jgi:selenide,water dikinase
VLANILSSLAPNVSDPNLIVGNEHFDDAAVYRINETQSIVSTTDFFTPIVNSPHDFGRIAAANAISDIYAMGARPILALSIVCMPIKKIDTATIRSILNGGAEICSKAGIAVAGGHSIDSEEPIYGLAVNGLTNTTNIKTNRGARPRDRIILGKPLGIGILSNNLKKLTISDSAYGKMIRYTTRLNTPGIRLGSIEGVHAMTDVTGFGLLGHLLEICRASGLSARLNWESIPLISEALDYAKGGSATGASGRNWQSYGERVRLPENAPEWMRNLLTDPQTSGGLLVAVS